MKIDSSEFGMPLVDNTPMGIIQMEGQTYRAMANRKRNRSVGLRILIVFIAAVLLVIPGAGIPVLFLIEIESRAISLEAAMLLLIPILISLVIFSAGIKIIFNNLKPIKK